ncbi:MAG: pantoate--beta-alanine ligase, partial [Oscillospiraceae bacterium]|nr:pantoate--beta-alanine ligase [Oscillospiraceae bacterium]
IRQEIEKEPLAQVEYVEVLDADTLENIPEIEPDRRALAAAAVRFGKTRLIDNTILSLEDK